MSILEDASADRANRIFVWEKNNKMREKAAETSREHSMTSYANMKSPRCDSNVFEFCRLSQAERDRESALHKRGTKLGGINAEEKVVYAPGPAVFGPRAYLIFVAGCL